MIKIIDYQLGNIASILNMLRKVGAEAKVAKNPGELENASKIILPGVGSFDAGVKSIRDTGFDTAIDEIYKKKNAYIFGICLGMQLLFEQSEEGSLPGLSLVPGRVTKFRFENQAPPVPHMGWNIVYPKRESSLFSMGHTQEERFYFVHSYYPVCADRRDITATAFHGYEFICAVERDNVIGVQFHPEKSHRFGMALMKKFSEL